MSTHRDGFYEPISRISALPNGPLSIALTVPLPPNAANNVGGHFMVDVKKKRAYWRLLDLRKLSKRIPNPPWPSPQGAPEERIPPEKCRITWTWYVWQEMDVDNLYRRGKPLVDWLRANSYIKDDSEKHLEYAHPPVQVRDRRNMRVEITIEAI